MAETTRRDAQGPLPSWGLIASLVVFGVVMVGFGNADRMFLHLMSQGAQLPGVVTDVRSYRQPESASLTYVPKVAFRDHNGKIRIMEPRDGPPHYPFEANQPVLVEWHADSETIAIDLPLQRTRITSIALTLLTAIGLACWAWGIWLILRRIIVKTIRMGQ